ncbi:MAG: PTS sugar transporter subunit IIA [Mycoplasmatales bacterium]
MFGIIITGHGEFGYGIEKTIELIMGKQEKISFLNFNEEITPENLSKKMKESIKEMNSSKGTLILADIKGGTPFNVGVTVGSEIGNIEVIGGCNLPMLIEALDIRENSELKDSIEIIINSAKSEIEAFKKNKKIDNLMECDGI